MIIDIDKFMKAIEFGSDIEFSYDGKNYTILPWTAEGIVIGEQNTNNDYVYKTPDELINNFMIGEKYIKDIINELDILLI